MNRQRICIVNNIVTPYTHRVYQEVARRAAWKVAVLSCAESEPGRNWARSETPAYDHLFLDGWRVHLGGNRNVYLDPRVGRALQALAPDALMLAGFTPTMLFAARWARERGLPTGVMVDAWASQDLGRYSPLHALGRRWLIGGAVAGAGASRKSVALLEHYGLSAQACRVVPLVPAWDAPHETPSWSAREFDLLWSGTINEEPKGVRFFVDVLCGLVDSGFPPRVRVVGTGPLAGWLGERIQQLGISAQFDGYLAQDQLAQVYASARVLLFPTRRDAWGLVANEALQCGTPVLVTPHAGCAGELVIDGLNGAVLPREVAAWVGAARALLLDEQSWMRASAAARASTEQVTVASSATALEWVFERLAGCRP